ncbi:MAG: FAD-binding oxidoreductase [Verrucomicrobiota bacterium JB025]|nr:FAD-binding oxidoreductase [Verrucomicrobiota bacterium JB025]
MPSATSATIPQTFRHPTSPSTKPPKKSGRSRPHSLTLAFAASLLLASCATTTYPKSFTTDGCSAFPDGTPSDPTAWRHHCVEHDRAYWAGGTREQRREADRNLANRITADGRPIVGTLTWLGTRVGGHPLLPTPWRWGYAWKYGRGYHALSETDRAALEATHSSK